MRQALLSVWELRLFLGLCVAVVCIALRCSHTFEPGEEPACLPAFVP